MKERVRIIFFSAATLFSGTVFAQEAATVGLRMPTDKGSVLLGSNFLVSDFAVAGGSGDAWLSYNVQLSPRAGYFVRDNLALGLTVDGQVAGAGNQYFSAGGGLGVFGRYYFGKSTDAKHELQKTRFFLEAGGAYHHGRGTFTRQDGSKERFSGGGTRLYFMPGVNYFINRNVALEGGLNFTYVRYRESGQYNSGDVRMSFNVGLQFFLGGR